MEKYLYTSPSGYVSCIRIDGKPILPPLIDDSYRAELLHDKNLATLVEKKLSDRKRPRENRHSIDSGVISTVVTGYLSTHSSPLSEQQPVKNKNNAQTPNKCLSKKLTGDHDTNIFDTVLSERQDLHETLLSFLTSCAEVQDYSGLLGSTNEYVTVSEFDVQENSQSATISMEKDCISFSSSLKSSFAATNLSEELSKISAEAGQGSKTDEKDDTYDTDKREVISSDEGTDTEFFDGEDELESEKSEEQSANKIVEVLQSEDSAGINEECSPSLALGSLDLQLVPPNDKLTLNKSLFCGSGGCLSPNITLRCKSENYMHSTPVEQWHCEPNTVRKLFSFEDCSKQKQKEKECSSVSKLCASNLEYGLAGEVVVDVTPQSTSDDKNSQREDSPTEYPESNVQSQPSSIDISSSSTSSKTVIDSQHSMVTATQPNKVKAYDPSLYDDHVNDQVEGLKPVNSTVEQTSILEKFHESKPVVTRSEEKQLDNSEDLNAADSDVSKTDSPLESQNSVSISDLCSTTEVVNSVQESCSAQSAVPADNEKNLAPPRLVRQNSYTLDSPSPVLLAHLQAIGDEVVPLPNPPSKSMRKGWNLPKARGDWDSYVQTCMIYAAPCKESQAIRPIKGNKSGNQKRGKKDPSKMFGSLPGSSVSSPIKSNQCHSSLESIPLAFVRKYQTTEHRKSVIHTPVKSSQRSELFNSSRNSGQSSFLGSGDRFCSISYSEFGESGQSSRSIKKLNSRSKSDLTERSSKRNNSTNNARIHQYSAGSVKSSPMSKSLDGTSKNKEKSVPWASASAASEDGVCSFSLQNMEFGRPATSDEQSQTDQKQGSDSFVEQGTQITCSEVPRNNSPTVQDIFLQLQNQHSQLMAQLLERQKKEQESLANTFLSQQRQILQEMNLIPSPVAGTSQNVEMHNNHTQAPLSVVISPENSLNLDIVESHLSSSVEMTPGTSHLNQHNSDTSASESRQLFQREELQSRIMSPKISPVERHRAFINSPKSEKQEKAATVINAAVRGYLTRRLLKTEYVQDIINTISDTVQCALQLQRECPVDITPSDVQLHKRLIQQLTAACYSLHDAFFASSLPERMAIIANDREKQKRGARPSSSSSRTSLTVATQKYLQRKQQQQMNKGDRLDRPVSARRTWWRSKSRISSAGQCEQSAHCYLRPTSGQKQQNNRTSRRPWR